MKEQRLVAVLSVMARVGGVEPPPAILEIAVLPLNETRMVSTAGLEPAHRA